MDQSSKKIIVLVDMDCFYCQVEEQLNKNLIGKPIVVVQYNEWQGGGIIAVNYEARKWGVERHMRGNEAKKKCPELNVISVPSFRGRANLNKYREAGKRVLNVLLTFSKLVQRASIDEAYMDITDEVESRWQKFKRKDFEEIEEKLPNTYVVGFETVNEFLITNLNNDNLKLLIGAVIVEEIRREIDNVTGYKCSAGIAANKILAKLVCSLHKPNKQTILPDESLDQFLANVPIRKIHNLGGKFGSSLIDRLKIDNILELRKFSENELMQLYDSRLGSWLYNICRGIDLEPVTARINAQSVGCSKKFAGQAAIRTINDLKYWLNELTTELIERLANDFIENNRYAKQIILHYAQNEHFTSKSCNLVRKLNLNRKQESLKYVLESLEKIACFESSTQPLHVTYLGLNATKFEQNVKDITDFFDDLRTKQSQKSFVLNWITINFQTQFQIVVCPICELELNFDQNIAVLNEHFKVCLPKWKNRKKKGKGKQ